MREKFLIKLADWHANHPWRLLGLTLLFTVIMWICMMQISVTMRTSDLLPEEDPNVVQFNKIVEEFNTSTNLVVVVQGEEEQIKRFADRLAPQIEALYDNEQNSFFEQEINRLDKELRALKAADAEEEQIAKIQEDLTYYRKRINFKIFQRVEYKAEIDFLRDHALMLVDEEDLPNTKDIFTSPNLTALITNLNNSMEKEYVGREESISTREKEDGAVAFLDGIQGLVADLTTLAEGRQLSPGQVQQTADRLLFGDPYMLSYDKTTLVMIAVPNFTLMDRDLIMTATIEVQTLVDQLLPEFPGVQAGLSGDIAKEHDEQVYSQEALNYSTIIALIVILILLIIAFRMWVAPLFAIITLIVGVIWALGAAWLVVGQLNMVTSMMAVVLLGLGIDFAIHVITGFTENRAAGKSIQESLQETYLKNGKGVITGALTTACAFLTLMISESRGMKEMGMVTGIGLLSILLATMLFMPILLVFRERNLDKRRSKREGGKVFEPKDISFRFLGQTGVFLSRHFVFTIIASAVVTILLTWQALKIGFDTDFRNIEPEGLKSIALMDTVLKKFDLSLQYAFILTDSIEESRQLAEACRELSSVAMTSDISLYLPSEKEQKERIPHLVEIQHAMQQSPIEKNIKPPDIATLVQEIDRLQMNVMEMQDMAFIGGQDKVDEKCKQIVGDPDEENPQNDIAELIILLRSGKADLVENFTSFQIAFAPYFKEAVLRMSSTNPIVFDELPLTIQDRYSNRDRTKFLVTAYPAGDMWIEENLYRFAETLQSVSPKATGIGPMALALMEVFGADGRKAVLLTLTIVFILLWVDLRGIRYALMAMIPLACGIFWMVGIMNLSGIQLTIMSVVGLPMIIGIGIDDGVHIMHRWRAEGRGRIQTVFASTGKAILLTSITTGFAFGSLVFSAFRGWAQFGGVLAIGVATCFLTTILILPGIIGFIERK